VDKRPYAPGQHGQGRRKLSEYGLQLREKQKVRRIYGINEKQFRRYFAEAERQKGVTGEILMRLLERRLDNVIYRLGFAASRPQARQLVLHGHVQVNGKKVNIPSYLVSPGDVIAVTEHMKNSEKVKMILESTGNKVVPSWLEFDADNLTGRVVSLPNREEIDLPVREQLIVELYSK